MVDSSIPFHIQNNQSKARSSLNIKCPCNGPTNRTVSQFPQKKSYFNIIALVTIFSLIRQANSQIYNHDAIILDNLNLNPNGNYGGTEKLKNALQTMQDNQYEGKFVSRQPEPFLDWISQKQGQIYTYIQQQDPNYVKQAQYSSSSIFALNNQITTKYDKILERIESRNKNKNIDSFTQNTGVQQILISYSVNVVLLNPKYITEQILSMKLLISPQILNPNSTYQNVDRSENVSQICTIITETEWQCTNTMLNYTKYRKSSDKVDEGTLNVSYKIKLTLGELNKADNCSIQLQLTSASSSQMQFSQVLQQNSGISFGVRQPLIITDHRFKTLIFCVFISSILFVQAANAHAFEKRLSGAHGLANKYSLLTIAFCTITDLRFAINIAYGIFNAHSAFEKVFYVLPTILLVILYIFYDIKILTRVLMTHYAAYVDRMGGPNNARIGIKKALLLFYLVFFISYEGLIFLYIFFQYEWWLVLITSFFILLPQIIRNVRIGSGGDGGFDIHYIVGYLATRYAFILYDHACPDNVYKIKPSIWLSILLVVCLIAQIAILYCQSKYSARFFIPKRLRQNYYEYEHRIRVSQQPDIIQKQCTICLLSLAQNPQDQDDTAKSKQINKSLQNQADLHEQMLSRNNKYPKIIEVYITPCNHMFHQQCLKAWIQIKLECPSCRSALPML